MQNSFAYYFETSGVVAYAMLAVAVVLYNILFSLIFELYSKNKSVQKLGISEEFGSLQNKYFAYFKAVNLKLKLAAALAAALPLLGLLGTVLGMEICFVSNSGSYDIVALGVSKALLTTQAGLVLSLPSFVFVFCAKYLKTRLVGNLQNAALPRKKNGGAL